MRILMLSRYLIFPLLMVLLVFSLSGCSKAVFVEQKNAPKRIVASESNAYLEELQFKALTNSHVLEFPPGVSASEQYRMWHLSEGSDIYPTLWLINLKSFLSNQKETYFFERLDKKYNAIKSPYGKDDFSPYSWVGLTAVWDGEAPEQQDLLLDNVTDFRNIPKIRKLKNGTPSIVMTGTNCAFCHTGSIENKAGDKHPLIIDGASSSIELKGFFYDIIGSTYQTMFNTKELIGFYERMGVNQAESKAVKFVLDLKRELDVEDSLLTQAITFLIKTPVIGKKVNKVVTTKAGILLYEKKNILTKYMVRMLKETYDLDVVSPLMIKRLEYLTWFGAPNPDVITTPEGHGRTDAFGRISNATIRKKSYTHLTAPVSLPPMYGMKYKAFYHYNGNTNSLVSRNVGQAFGLGAIVTKEIGNDGKKVESTVNLPNLITLEKLIHKVPVPEYTNLFPDRVIRKDLLVRGCEIYASKCLQCHEAPQKRVGPKNILIDHKITSLETIDTDRQYLKNISKSALGVPFKTAIFDFTNKVKDGYYDFYGVNTETQREYANEDVRGKEIFRDTYLGENRFNKDSDSAYANIAPGAGYVARHLAGVWSSAPYLHNGSVMNLYELLLPENLRSKKFIVSRLDYDHSKLGFKGDLEADSCKELSDPRCLDTSLSGNSNTGHSPAMYGGELKDKDKLALLEFLKVLTPELETSWRSIPLYKIENDKCVLR